MRLLRRIAAALGLWRCAWWLAEPRYLRGMFIAAPSHANPERVVRWLMARGVKQPTCWRGPDGLVRGTGIVN